MRRARRRRSDDAEARLQGLADVAALIWPGALTTHHRGLTQAAGPGEMAIVPGLAHPRVLIPVAQPRAAAQAILRQGQARTIAERAQRRALALLIRSGAGSYLFRHGVRTNETPTLIDHLGGVLGEPVVASLALSAARANRKPVLHLLDSAGRTVAFAKVGVNPLTRELVRREAEALRHLAQANITALRVPEVVRSEEWNGLELLVLSPLPIWRGELPTPQLLATSMRAVAAHIGDRKPASPGSGYADDLIERADGMRERASSEDRLTIEELAGIVLALEDAVTASLPLGAWHGDWTPWNCCQLDSACLVWDWERYGVGVPRGFDALHYELQRAVQRGSHHRAAASACVDHAPDVLASWSLNAAQARSAAVLYLAEIGLRYIGDRQRYFGGAGGNVADWILPALRSAIGS